MQTFRQIGTQIGFIVEEKNQAYGSSFATSGDALRLLFPQGISAERFTDVLLLARIWDKMMRIATNRDALGEDPYADIVGYGILGVHMHQHKEGSTGSCASASDQVAEDPSQAQSDSAEPSVPARTTPSANGKSEPSSRMQCNAPSPSTSVNMDAPALSATERASRLEAVLENAEEDNSLGKCAGCGWVRILSQQRTVHDRRVLFCGMACVDDFKHRVEALQ